jgi:DNA-binding MarR family transcriptional regulator
MDEQVDLDQIERALSALGRLAVQRPLHEQTMAQAGSHLERSSVQVLARLGECGPVRLSDLAGKLSLTVSTASRHVAQLEREALIQRVDDPADRRSAVLHLTETGRDLLARIKTVRRQRLERMLAAWTPDERHQLAVLLTRLMDDIWAIVQTDQPQALRAELRPGRPTEPAPLPGASL